MDTIPERQAKLTGGGRRVSTDREGEMMAAVGSLVTITVASLLSTVRDHVGQTNVVLVFVLLIVAAAAIGGRLAGVITAVMATLSFNFFFTKPYLTLRITDADDVIRMLLLLLVGLLVGEVTHRAQLRRLRYSSTTVADDRIRRLVVLLRDDAPIAHIWSETQEGIVQLLDVEACRFERFDAAMSSLPEIADAMTGSRRHTFVEGGFTLPTVAQLSARHAGMTLGRIVVSGEGKTGVSVASRTAAATLADLFALRLAHTDIPSELV